MGAKISTRPRLQPDDVVDRAMEMADSEGLEAVTIRRLAQELGVTPMALYWHFADKEALMVAISERMWADVARLMPADQAWAPEAAGGWGELRAITAALVSVLRRHPGCATLAPLGVFTSEAGLDITERVLEILDRLGIPADLGGETAHFVLSSAITMVATRPGGDVSVEDREAHLRAKKAGLASLPPERYPRVTAMAGQLVDCPDTEGYFERGIDFVIGGIQASGSAARG